MVNATWIENADGTLKCSVCGIVFPEGHSCSCKPGDSAALAQNLCKSEASPAGDVMASGSPGSRIAMTADDYERELYELGLADKALAKQYERASKAACRMYWGDFGEDDEDGIKVEGIDDGEPSPRRSYECQRDSIRLRKDLLDSKVKFLAERRKRLEILYRMAHKRTAYDKLDKAHETVSMLNGHKATPRTRDAN